MRDQDTQVNFQKMRQSGYLLQNFAIFTDMGETGDPLEEALRMADLFFRQMEQNQDMIVPVQSWRDIEDNMACGKMSALLTLEEGGVCKGDPAFLSVLFKLGARMMTLTWNYENELAYPNFDIRKKRDLSADEWASSHDSKIPADRFFHDLSGHGLKEQGVFFLEEMERMGMIIDVSHLSDAGFYDVLKYTKKPFAASHSNARSICNAKRNLTDDMIRRLAGRGGIAGVNFCTAFLGNPEDGGDYIDRAVLHLKHLTDLGGADFAGLGSDFDGIPPCDDIADCSVLPKLIDRMEKAGFSHTQIEKICYKNVLRFYKELLP